MKRYLLLLCAFAAAWPVSAQPLDFEASSRIVIQAGGRKKPLDSFARESIRAISGRTTVRQTPSGESMSAMDALFSIWFSPENWHHADVVLVPSAQARDALGLSGKERRFSIATLGRNPKLSEFHQIIRAKRIAGDDPTPLEKEVEAVIVRYQRFTELFHGQTLTIVPHPTEATGTWVTPAGAEKLYGKETGDRLAARIKDVATAYQSRDSAAFASASEVLRFELSQLTAQHYPAADTITREVHYNQLHPFRWAWWLYLAAFFVLLVPRAWPAGITLFGAGLFFNTYGFVLRTWISGNAPVTNMYESVVWVALGTAAFAFGYGLKYKSRLYLLTAAPIAVLGLVMADMLPTVLDPKIGPLPPVLRDNFWLATHVLTITLGYAAFALAMGVAHVLLVYYLFKPKQLPDNSPYHQLVYRVLQIGILLLAAGTILGGVWANYSWGRFWGWDPKETWALIALLMYIFALHGRVAGWWGNFGLSVAAAVCFNGVLMAWYGVNFVLGKGLHSYGFGGGGVNWMIGFVFVDLLFVSLCVGIRLRRSAHRRASLPIKPSPAAATIE